MSIEVERDGASPALCRLQLGNELRQLRLAAGLKGAQVVRKLLWSPSKLTRLETGENTAVETADVMALCEIYEVDRKRRDVLLSYAAVTKTRRDWWLTPEYRPLISPGFKAFLDLEAAAETVLTSENAYVPGLLQTADYVRALHRRSDLQLSAEDRERIVEIRLARQAALTRGSSPLRYRAIIDEGALRRQVGDPSIMRAQLARLVELVEALPNVRVQVLPFKVGAHTGMNGPFLVFRFPTRLGLKPLVYVEHLADTWVKRDERQVSRFENAFSELQALALGPHESVDFIHQAIKEQ